MTALSFHAVRHAFGRNQVLRDFTLSIEPGTIVALLGASGSGKTTALRIAAGLEIPQAGDVRVGGKPVTAPGLFIAPESRDVGLLFQDLALFPHLDVEGNVAFGLKLSGTARRNRVGELLELVGLAGMARLYPHQLSGGQQQRVALARALAPGPGVLLLDEPFSSLDVVLRQQVRSEMVGLLKAVGTAVLFVTHDPEEALYVADRVAVMAQGAIVQEASPDNIWFRPANRFVAEFFGDTNTIPATVTAGRAETGLGSVDAQGLPDGPADVVVRAAGLRLGHGEGLQAVVRSSRILGPAAQVELVPRAAAAGISYLIARTPISEKPETGATVSLTLDPRMTFVFPRAR
ncbi:MAG: ABC transporter ATP-binding protein [Alphaproteobacteria bacterium]